ncbi:helix-turn-helix transcriptional regulator [Actinomadura fulvescens]|uniref:HTH cro/C1-type domain-containing protein n=1 Tax=Actinomadura fulvescens TaxID=46160 RepID=A0ABN3QVN0_9ACTN
MTFGETLRQLMAEREISLRKLAKAVPCDPGHLSRISNDRKPPSPELAQRLDELLGAGGALVMASRLRKATNGDLTPEDEERLLLAARKPTRADMTVVDNLATILSAQRRTEDVVGSAPLIEPVRAQVRAVAEMVKEARGPMRAPLLDVGAQWSQFAGWLHANVGRPDRALGYLGMTLEWASERGDRAMVGAVMSWRGYVAERAGQIGPLIGLSQAGQRLRDSVGRVYDLYQESRGHALLGDADEVDRLTSLAAEEAEGQRPENGRPWEYYYFAPGFFTMEHGVAYRILGRTDPSRNAEAVEFLTRGLGELPAEMRESEWAGEFVYQLGRAYLQAREREEAGRLAVELAGLAERIGSERIARQAAALHA